jgi:hypothetical protein
MTAKTEDEILEELEESMESMFPRLQAMDSLTLHYILNRALAQSLAILYTEIEAVVDQVDVLQATGDDLEHLVSAHLLTRTLGDCATGYLTFRRNVVPLEDITIPMGTKCRAGSLFFTVTSAGTMTTGDTTVSVPATCDSRGTDGNVAAYTVTEIYSELPAIDTVENPLAFSGGTEDEDDESLRQRYIDIVTLPGLATPAMLTRRLEDVAGVSEVLVVNHGYGDVQAIVDYSGGLTSDSDDIIEELETCLAAGCQGRGCHAAVATVGGDIASVIDPVSLSAADTAGGHLWLRPLEPVLADDTFDIDYRNVGGMTQTVTTTVPAGTPRGRMVKVDLGDPAERAVLVPDKAFTGAYAYDVLIGMGEAGYLYEIPSDVTVTVNLTITPTDTPETDLAANIQASIEAWLSDYAIGEVIQWSDLRTVTVVEYSTATTPTEKHVIQGDERVFVGVDKVVSMYVSGGGTSMSYDGEEITLESDQIARCGDVFVTIV